MAENRDQAAAGEAVAATDAGAAPIINLPAIVAPNISASEAEVKHEAPDGTATAAAPARSKRFAMLAASVAFAAAFGSFVGSVSGSGLARFIFPSPTPSATPTLGIENTLAAMHEIKLQLAGIAAIKANLENATRNATSQFAKIADRLDRIDQRSTAAVETTASLPTPPQSLSSPVVSAADPAKLNDRVLQDWIVHDVRNGRALVESRYGGLFAVGAGSVLPGIGRVDMIKRQDGHWVVLTARGTIVSAR
jgi:hypothetical protein